MEGCGFASQSTSIKELSASLLKAQKKMGSASKDKANPFYKSKYADLSSVLEVCKDPLNENGISILQPVLSDAVGDYVLTTLLHESGEFISSKQRIVVKEANNPQAQGSAITYARRYGLQALLSIPAEDDDGEKAMVRTPAAAPKMPTPLAETGTIVFKPSAVRLQEQKNESWIFHSAGHVFISTIANGKAAEDAKKNGEQLSITYKKGRQSGIYDVTGFAIIGG